MPNLMDSVLRRYFVYRQQRIDAVLRDPWPYQDRLLSRILRRNASTEYGQTHVFGDIQDGRDYAAKLPLVRYEDLYPLIARMMDGEQAILVQDRVRWYAKSSGTSNDRSKYIPITRPYLIRGHLKCTWFAASSIYHENPDAKLFAQKNLIMVGSLSPLGDKGVLTGDISAIMMSNYPWIGRRFSTPAVKLALTEDWDEKLDLIVRHCQDEKVTLLGGVPTWTLILIKRLLRHTGRDTLTEVWPELRTYVHGGVGFEPYREEFRRLLPADRVTFREAYNATEGYFGFQQHAEQDGMTLMMDHETYYEFIPLDRYDGTDSEALSLRQVKLDVAYVLVISNSSGLYRYIMGDVISFVSLKPYKIKVLGRTEQHINVFGEELMMANVDQAVAEVSRAFGCRVKDYTVGPVFLTLQEKGGHEWAVEFDVAPEPLADFEQQLDRRLRELNSDYDAKRSGDIALAPLKINVLPSGRVEQWQRARGKYGRQHKMPRLRNDRALLDQLLQKQS